MSDNTHYFLEDIPKGNLASEDAFGHADYAQTLLSVIQHSDPSVSYAIGLYGSWGIGKTSIIGELNRLLDPKDKDSFALVSLDVWKFAEESFGRDFLLSLAKVVPEPNIEASVGTELTERGIIESHEPPTFKTKDIIYFLSILIGAPVLSVLFFWAASHLGLVEPVANVVSITPLFGALVLGIKLAVEYISPMLKPVKKSVEVAPPVYADEYRQILEKTILANTKLYSDHKGLVIVLDNLDRITDQVVLQVLSSIKTFLSVKKCIYIIPCDEAGLIRHISKNMLAKGDDNYSSIMAAREYLRKFFHTTITVRALLENDLSSYVESLVEGMKVFQLADQQLKEWGNGDCEQTNKETVSFVLQVAGATNPRRLIKLANKITTNALLAIARADRGEIALGRTVLSNLGFLGKLTIVEEEWPHFYQLLTECPEVLLKLQSYFSGVDIELPQELKSDSYPSSKNTINPINIEWSTGLEQFLRQTLDIHCSDVSAFVRLKKSPAELGIPNYDVFFNAVITSDTKRLLSIIEDKEISIDDVYMELIRTGTRKRLSNYTHQTSVLRCIVSLSDRMEEASADISRKVADHFSTSLNNNEYTQFIFELGLSGVLGIAEQASHGLVLDGFIAKVITNLIDPSSNEGVKDAITVASHHKLLSNQNRALFREKLSAKVPSNFKENIEQLTNLEIVVAAIIEQPTVFAKATIPSSFYQLQIERIKSAELEESKAAAQVLQPLYSVMDDKSFISFTAAVLTHLQFDAPQLNDRHLHALDLVDGIPEEKRSKEFNKNVLTTVVHRSNNYDNNEHKIHILPRGFAYLPKVDIEFTTEFVSAIRLLLAHTNEGQLSNILKGFINISKTTALTDEFWQDLRTAILRLTAEPKSDLYIQFIQLAKKQESFHQCTELVWGLWSAGHVLNAIDLFSQIVEYISKESIRSYLQDFIDKAEMQPDNTATQIFKKLDPFYKYLTDSLRESLVEVMLNKWLSPETTFERRKAGRTLWAFLKKRAKAEIHQHVVERLTDVIKVAVTAQQVDEQSNGELLDCILAERQHLSDANANAVLRVCLEAVEVGKPEPLRDVGYKWLMKLEKLPSVGGVVTEELVKDVTQTSDSTQIERILISLGPFKQNLSSGQKKKIMKTIDALEDEEVRTRLSSLIN